MSESKTARILSEETGEYKSYGFFALNILKTCAKKLFMQDSSLACLLKSESFLKELLNTFNKLHSFNINPETFDKIIKTAEISNTDKNRLLITAQLYDYYIRTMSQNSYELPAYRAVLIKNDANEAEFCKKLADFQSYNLFFPQYPYSTWQNHHARNLLRLPQHLLRHLQSI